MVGYGRVDDRVTTAAARRAHGGVPLPRAISAASPGPVAGPASATAAGAAAGSAAANTASTATARSKAQQMAAAVVGGVRRDVAELADLLGGPFGEVYTAAMHEVLLCGVETGLGAAGGRRDWTAMCGGLGTVAFNEGASLDAVAALFRVGGRLACRQLGVFGRTQAWTPATVDRMLAAAAARAVTFEAASTEGFTAAQLASGRESCRAQLLRMLLRSAPVAEDALAQVAGAARWTVPDSVVAVALARPVGAARDGTADLGPTVLGDLDGELPCLLAAADDPALARLPTVLPGWRAAIGPAVPPGKARSSLRLARRAVDRLDTAMTPGAAVLDCMESAVSLALLADDFLADQLIRRRLAPLDGLTERQRARMLGTLRQWLATRGRTMDIAENLGLHPQTVRYRLRKLETLFGDQLADGEARFELDLAVRAELLRTKTDIDE